MENVIYFWVVIFAVMMFVVTLIVVGFMRVFKKAGKPQWAAIIPLYNTYVELEIIRKPKWWIWFFVAATIIDVLDTADIIAYIVALAAFVVWIIMAYHLSKVFGKSAWFALGLVVLPFIFYPILGFGMAQYQLSTNSAPPIPPTPTPDPVVPSNMA